MWNVWVSFSALSEMWSKIQTRIPRAVLTPRIVTRLMWCRGRRLEETSTPKGATCPPAALNAAKAPAQFRAKSEMSVPWGHVGNQGCKRQPGCVALQPLPSVWQQLPGTPRAELGCSQDLALQHLFSVTILSSCQSAHKEHKQEKGNRDF